MTIRRYDFVIMSIEKKTADLNDRYFGRNTVGYTFSYGADSNLMVSEAYNNYRGSSFYTSVCTSDTFTVDDEKRVINFPYIPERYRDSVESRLKRDFPGYRIVY